MQNRNEKTSPVPRRIWLLDVVLETARGEAGERTLKALLVLEEYPTSKGIATAWAQFGQSSVKLRPNESGKKLMLCFSITNAFRGRDAWDTYPLQWLQEKAEDALSRFDATRAMTNPLPLVLQRASEWLRHRERQEEEALRGKIPTVLGVHLIDEPRATGVGGYGTGKPGSTINRPPRSGEPGSPQFEEAQKRAVKALGEWVRGM